MTNKARQTIQQQRASYAFTEVKKLLNPQTDKELLTYVRGLPAMIQTNGLGQAMAFYFAKGKTHLAVYNLVGGWLMKAGRPYGEVAEGNNQQLLECIVNSDQADYRLAQAEAQALMSWVVKFTQAYAKAGDTQVGEG